MTTTEKGDIDGKIVNVGNNGSVPILLMKLICIKSFKINQYKSHYFGFSIYLEAKKVI